MKYLLYPLLVICFFTACKKDDETPTIIIEPPVDIMLSTDTLTSGQLWGLSIGEAASNIYSTIQEIGEEKNVTYLGVVGNVFTDLSTVQNSIPLYASVFLDEAKGTSTGIQFSIAENKVASIWTNNGEQLNKWPVQNTKSHSITKGDPVESLYQKLVNIKTIKAFEKKFERISIFNKDVSKQYDSHMSVSPQWYFRSAVDNERYYLIYLNFIDGKLVSIYSALFKVL